MTPNSEPETNGRWWPAPAKLNLFLHITGRRPDGFHNLQTLFQLLDWGDEIYLAATDDGKIERQQVEYGVAPEDDLTIRAARSLQSAAGCHRGVSIEVRKQIPLGSGLGGASSNAATVLSVLNHLWGCGLSVDALAALGLGLGADVPVFVHGHSAMATGVGENLESVALGRRHYLLVLPDISISTSEVFVDDRLKRDSAVISTAQALSGGGRNDCEAVALSRHPQLSATLDELSEYGQPRMSGTGSALFVQMPSQEAASSAAGELKCRYNVRAVGGLDESLMFRALLPSTQG